MAASSGLTRASTGKAWQGRGVVAGLAYIVIVPVCAHLLFSSLGFNPTDDGFVLAFSRRLIEHQVPHRDFISVRPALSALLGVPFVLFGGEYVFWLSRFFVWIQFALISWAWMLFLSRLFVIRLGIAEMVLASIVIFTASVHTFPIMAWSTIDGIFFTSLGLLFWLRGSKASRLVGYVLIGAAPLCKQSFLWLPIAALIVSGDWRHIRNWLAMAVPGILYLFYLGWDGAIQDALVQVLSPDGLFFSVGIWRYVTDYALLWGIILGYAIIGFEWPVPPPDSVKPHLLRLVQMLVVFLILAMDALVLARGKTGHIFRLSFLLFGVVLGPLLRPAFWRERPPGTIQATAMVLVTAWSASLSNGYNAPVLMAGPLAFCLLAHVYFHTEPLGETKWSAKMPPATLTALAALLLVIAFAIARFDHIYRDLPAPALTRYLDGVLPGGKQIRTNSNTYDYLADLHTAIARTNGRIHAILPDNAGFWVKHSQVNPLPADWADWLLPEGSGKPSQLDRMVEALETRRGRIVVIVQKVSARSLAMGFEPLAKARYPIVDYVRASFTKVGETKYFELYE